MEELMISNCSIVTHGYDIFSHTILPSKIFSVHDVPTAYGMSIPSMTKIQQHDATEITQSNTVTLEDLVKSRLANLNFNWNLEQNYIGCQYLSKEFYHSSSSNVAGSEQSRAQHSIIHEEKLFDVSLENVPLCEDSYTYDFIAAVNELPDVGYGSDPDAKEGIDTISPNWEWYQFFRRWGPFVVTKASGGGSIEIKLNSRLLDQESKDKRTNVGHMKELYNSILMKKVTNFSTGEGEEKSKESSDSLSKATINVVGGSINSRNFGVPITPEELKNWKDSLKTNPEMLTTNMVLEPITTFVKIVNPEKYFAANRLLDKYLSGSLQEDTKQE